MARLNTPATYPPVRTHEGAPAVRIAPLAELRRSVLTALLWEDGFYESGSAHAKRIAALVAACKPNDVAALAIEARDAMFLRHVPLFLVRELARMKGHGRLVAGTLAHVIQRPDELGEYLAMYWAGKASGTAKRPEPLSAGSKRGLAAAFRKFKPETLAKYDRDSAVKLRDVLRLTHAKPKDASQAATWKQVITRTLDAPDTWEVQLSAGKNKRDVFERLLREDKLGGLAFLRNLRNMIAADVERSLIRARFDGNFDKVLPFRFLAAVRHAPSFASDLDRAMLRISATQPKLMGRTIVLVDTSPSMAVALSAKSEMQRMDAAAGLAVLVREIADDARIFAFSAHLAEAPSYRGLALVDAIKRAVPSSGTLLGAAIHYVNQLPHDRLIVLTDEESQDRVPPPVAGRAYMINLSTSQNGVGYGQGWTAHVTGWSDRVLDYIRAVEVEPAP
jgi:60 kDa SS-A/Ro ribonucleoprotein